MQEIVDWAIQYDLYVVMNIHGDGYSTIGGGWILPDAEDQAIIKEKYRAVWAQIADRFKDYDQHVIYESMNEIGARIAEMKDGEAKDAAIATAYENINDYNQIFVDTVRQSGGNNDRRWLLVPGLNTNINYTAGDYGFQIPEDGHLSQEVPAGQKRIMISVHYYDPWGFCGQEDYAVTQWGEEADLSKKLGYGQEDDMKDQFSILREKFTSQGYPVVIGEYGSIDKTTKKDSGTQKDGEPDADNNKYRAYYAQVLCSLSVQNGCVPIYWDNGWNGDFGFGLIDRSTYKDTQPEIIQAIVGCFQKKEGGATAVAIKQQNLQLESHDTGMQLETALTPAESTDAVQWSSSDERVAKVGYRGYVRPAGVGTCLITATVPGGASAYCIVQVREPQHFRAGLFGQTAEGWNTLECDNYLEIAENGGGEWSLSISGTKAQMSKLCTLFLKDVAAQRGVSDTSRLESALFTVNSVSFNGHEASLSKNSQQYVEGDEYVNDQLTGKRTVPDICLLNSWYEPNNWITDLKTNATNNTGSSFPKEWYVEGTNTLTLQVKVTDAVIKEKAAAEEKPITDLSLSEKRLGLKTGETKELSASIVPADATESVLWFSENAKIATVDRNGKITASKEGETVIRALTASGKNAACALRVGDGTPPDHDADPVATPDPTAEPTPEPTAEPTAEPTLEPSAEPSTEPTIAPSAKPTADPGSNSGGNTGIIPSTTPKDSPETQGKILAKGTLFAAGKLKYKVTGTASGKTTVAVQGPKSKKATSLTIPASVKKSGISYAVTSVEANAFKNCKKVKKITVGKNVTVIGKNAFSGDKALKSITVKSVKLKKVGKNALKGIHKKAVIKVPKKMLKKYRKLWKKKGQKKSVKIK